MGAAMGQACGSPAASADEVCACFTPPTSVANELPVDKAPTVAGDWNKTTFPPATLGLEAIPTDDFAATPDVANAYESQEKDQSRASNDVMIQVESKELEKQADLNGINELSFKEINNDLDKAIQEARHAETLRCQQSYLEKEMTERRTSIYLRMAETRKSMLLDPLDQIPGSAKVANRYGWEGCLPKFEPGYHVPVLALINPMSGAMAGADILAVARQSPYYQNCFFNIVDVVKSQKREGGLLDVFRQELNKAKVEARKMGTRPRLISGGGDGTGSFALFMIFLALKADDNRAWDGLGDTGNGFIWTDGELADSFPAIAQMPLGSANDFGNILGWGEKYPGDPGHIGCITSRARRLSSLQRWVQCLIDPRSRVVNFDVWGLMPSQGAKKCDFKLAELTGKRGMCPNDKGNLQMKEAGKPVPFFVCLYFSAGFGAYMTARFQINRRKTPVMNRLEYTRQAVGIMLEKTPPQMKVRLDDVHIDSDEGEYFPPRKRRGRKYREVGFYNINWQAKALHGYDRASVATRLNPMNRRKPVCFNDGQMDLFRWKFTSLLKNPGLHVQTDKKKELHFRYDGGHGRGIFFQWDGEARFAFSASKRPFNIFIKKVLNIPVVVGPDVDERLTGPLDNGKPVTFEISGDTFEEKKVIRDRIASFVAGDLDSELNATEAEITGSGFCLSRS